MKKILFILPLVVLLLFSCASSPKKDDTSSTDQKPVDLGTAKSRAVDAMEKAKSIKAEVAASEEYNSALEVFNAAEKEASIEKYLEAERLFLASYETTRAKKEEAQRQLNKAKEDIKQVENEAEAFEKEQSGAAQGAPNR